MKKITITLLALFASITMINADVLTVSQAISQTMLLDSATTSEVEYTIEGYVVDAQSFEAQYGNQIWYMVDDLNDTSASRFYAYFCTPIDNGDTLKVLNGDKVQLTGKLTKYYNKSTGEYQPEIKKGVATFVNKIEGDHSVSNIPEEITVAQALEIGYALDDNTSTKALYTIRGYVSAINVKASDAYSNQYKNQSFYIADDATSTAASNADGAFYVYRGKPETEAEIPVGTLVEFTCQIRKYVSPTNGTLIESWPSNIDVKVFGDTIGEYADVVFTATDFEGQGQAATQTTPGGAVSATKDGVTVATDNGYGHNLALRVYKGAHFSITSAEQQIGKIVYQFYSNYDGGIDKEVIVNGMEYTVDSLTKQARIEKIYIYFGEFEEPLTINTDVFPVNSGQVIIQNDTLLATPNYGYHFVQWNDSITENPRAIILTQDTSFTAIFAPNLYSFSATCDSVYGTVEASSGEFPYLTEITISAIPTYGYHFDHWSDGNTENPRTVIVKQDSALTASFAPNKYEIRDESNASQGYISGAGSYDYLSERTIAAVSLYGYHFTKWSDGCMDITRTIVLTQDTTFAAEFALDKTGTCGANNVLTWYFDDQSMTLTITGSGTLTENYTYGAEAPAQTTRLILEEGVTSIGDYAFNGMGSTVTSLALPTTLTNIGDYAFAGFNNRKFNTLVLPNDIISIGAHAFDGASYVQTIYFGSLLEEIGEAAFNGCTRVRKMTCLAEITPNVGTDGLISISSLAELYVPNEYLFDYQIDNNWNRFVLKPIGATDATVTNNEVTVVADDNTATLTWPTSENADSYSIEITKDGVVFCTLIFNANGQLTGIAFAPSRNGQPHAPAATMTANGMQFTVTGLNSGTNYAFSVAAKNGETVLASYSGEFETTGAPAVATDLNNTSDNIDGYQKIVENGQILILRGNRTYTLTGQEVR